MRHRTVLRTSALAAFLLAAPIAAHADAQGSMIAFNQALAHFQAGDLRDARIELLNALKANPNNGVARLLFARVQLARGNGVAAQTEIERAVKAGIPREKTLHLTAHALLLQNKASLALETASSAGIPPQFGSYAARMRGRAQLQLGKIAAAGSEFSNAQRIAPDNPDVLVDLARYQIGSHDVASASKSIDRAIQLAPGNVEALDLKGGLVRATQGLEPSLAWFDRAIKTDGNSIEARLERAATLSDMKRYDAARADLKHVLGLIPNHPIALYLSAALAVREGKFQEAETILGQTKGVLDNYPPAQLLRADIALKQKNLGVAFENLSAIVARAPDNPGARRALAQVQLQRGDPRGALVTLEPLTKLPRLDAGTLAMMGSAHAQTGDFATAQEFFERAAKLAPNVAALQTQLAMTRMAQGDARGADAGLENVLKTDPKSVQALTSLTYVKLRAQDYRGALAVADRLVAAQPDLATGYNLRGTAALGLRDVKRAEAEFRTAIAKDPKFLDARRNLAQVQLITKRTDQGKETLRAIVAENANDTRSMMLLAELAGGGKPSQERIDWIKRAVLSAPRDPGPRVALVQTYLAMNQPGPALTEAASLSRERPTDLRLLQLLASAQMANKDMPNAVATARRIVELAPQNPQAKVLLARVQAAGGPSGLTDARATLQAAAAKGGPGADQAYMGLVQLEMASRNFDGALAAAEKLKAVTAQKLAADKLIGDINIAAGRAPAALAAYNRVRAKANNGQTAALVARAQSAMGQNDAALKTLTDYRAANPRDLIGGVALADVYVSRRDWRSAIATYLSMKNTPAANSPEVLNNLAFAYAETGDPRSIAAAARANQLAPNQPTIQDTYGWVLIKSGKDPKRALTLLQAAARGMPNDPNVRYHLGIAYKANGMRTEAARELKAAVAAPGLDTPDAARRELATLGG